MPLIAHSSLPTFARLIADGQEVLDPECAAKQDIRELHVGILNLMPDAALQATERQFMRMLGASNRIVQLYVHLFTVPGLERDAPTLEHIDRYYQTFDEIKKQGLDALIISGANVSQPDLTRETFYPAMCEVFSWARQHVASVLCSCLASHALWQHEYNIKRQPLPHKRWGVFAHKVVLRDHPLVSNINTRFPAPHSRFNDVPADALRAAGVHVLVATDDGEVLLAVSANGLSAVYLQGHPEYDAMSLAKEFKREVRRFALGELSKYPPMPLNYFSDKAKGLLTDYQHRVMRSRNQNEAMPEFPEQALMALIDNTWTDTGKAIFNNWLGLVYQTTHQNRCLHFMDGLDPDNPLGWHQPADNKKAIL